MDKDEIDKILEKHRLWINKKKGGERANLYGAYLSRADLSGADLYGADLSRANLSGANLYGADLSRANLYGADLSRANLSGADLSCADLSRANLYGANLYGAYLSGANLYGAYLSGADLYGANLSGADLSCANLSGANLSGANLSRANLYGANLSGADLSRAKMEFKNFPSISLLSSFNLGKLSDELTLELMRRDAWAHPHPERFDEWANGGKCPYQNEDRYWFFELRKDLWSPGAHTMRDSDLILEICKEKGWKINGYLE